VLCTLLKHLSFVDIPQAGATNQIASHLFAPIGDTRQNRAAGFMLTEIPVRTPLMIGTLNHARI
jgi:hypothetical protein